MSSEKNNMAEQRFTVSCEGDCVRVVLPMPPLIERLQQRNASVFGTEFWFTGRLLFQQDPPPRALFEIDADRFRMTLIAADLGERIETDWPRKDVVALRRNRYGHGLWLRVQGTVLETYLEDLDDDLVEALSAELWKIVKRFDEPAPALKSDEIQGEAGS